MKQSDRKSVNKYIDKGMHDMRRLLNIIFIFLLCAALLVGCASPASSAASISPSASPSPSVSAEPTDTAEASPAKDDTISNVITHEGWTYYLDEKDPAVTEYNEDSSLHMKKANDSSDQNLEIRSFHFDIIGNYIYVDSKEPDLNTNGDRTWITIRMNLDGSDKRELEYGNMSARLIPEGEQTFYFTETGESAVYISDFPCENVTALIVNLPDKSELDTKLGNDKVLQLDINSVSGGEINFDATFSAKDGSELYNGTYSITADGKTIKKLKGAYIDTSVQENEND